MSSSPTASVQVSSDHAWRSADERLLAALGEERAVANLWRVEAPGGARPLPGRARVLARGIAALSGGEEAVARAVDGDVEAFSALLRGSMVGWSAGLLHSAAIYFDRLARSFAAARNATAPGSAELVASLRAKELDATMRRMAAWMGLADEQAYLAGVTAKLAAGELTQQEIDELAQSMPAQVVDELAASAVRGARDISASAGLALAGLARVQDAGKLVSASAAVARRLVMRAERARARAIDEALAPIEDALHEAKTRSADAAELASLFGRVGSIWQWSERDVAVEYFAVDQVTPFAWEVYRHAGWAELREIVAPCADLYDSLEARLLARPGEITYAAKCAQVLVFRSEAETERAREWAYAERALKICPSHRNGRLVMAHLLSDHVISVLGRSTIFTGRADVHEMTPIVERAETLFPQSKRTLEARARLDAARSRWGGSR
ncbi:MAG: hypothetical protein HOW73_00205 [Polyangiaceae bacterium]|nr:hypothetical protein [Polyangiaceae bacterium]